MSRRHCQRAPEHWIEYIEDWRWAPMAYWVHVEQGDKSWLEAESYMPAAPPFIPHKGYALICVEYEGIVLLFSSRAQLEECIRVLALKPLPSSRRLAMQRGADVGPNSHWLSRLPASLKSPRIRPGLVKALAQVLSETTTADNPVRRRGKRQGSLPPADRQR